MPTTQRPDGTYDHVFSASWLEAFANCPEQARRRYYRLTPWSTNEMIALGSATHKGFEVLLKQKRDDLPVDLVLAQRVAKELFDGLVEEDNFRWLKYTPELAEEYFLTHIRRFHDDVLPRLEPRCVEEDFHHTLYSDAFRSVSLRGRIDYYDKRLGVFDWKTAGAEHRVWEKQKQAVQPSVYVWALRQMGGCESELNYMVFVNGKTVVQSYAIAVTDGNINWLKYQALAAARLVEANLPVWPLQDQSWHCSEKWCDAWSQCKGKFV